MSEQELNSVQESMILRRRTSLLAQRESLLTPKILTEKSHITFHLNEEIYAIHIRYVRQIEKVRHVTSLPGTFPYITGVIHLRGHVLIVVDLKKILQLNQDMPMTTSSMEKEHSLIIVDDGSSELALQVDGIGQFMEQPSHFTPLNHGFLTGVTKDQVIIINMEKFFSSEVFK